MIVAGMLCSILAAVARDSQKASRLIRTVSAIERGYRTASIYKIAGTRRPAAQVTCNFEKSGKLFTTLTL